MSDSCTIVAKVMTEGFKTFGKSEVTQIYVCTMAGVYAAPSAPIVCGSAAIASAVGKWATTPAGKALMEKALAKGCKVVVRVGKYATEIMLVEGEDIIKDVEKASEEVEHTYRALNTPQGINWLMRYVGGY